ncbi:hypothetical protein QPK87_20440 [Kamptonema cortianum]|nr:hypothetical protein [Kamptonema cortianum]
MAHRVVLRLIVLVVAGAQMGLRLPRALIIPRDRQTCLQTTLRNNSSS